MKLKIAVCAAVLMMPLVGLWVSKNHVPRAAVVRAQPEVELLNKLSMVGYEERMIAPDFKLSKLRGETVNLSDFRGQVVLLTFWATWCPSCRLEMPSMERLHNELGHRGLTILAINFRENRDEIASLYEEHHLTFTALLDEEALVFDRYRSRWLPTTFLINKKGEIVGSLTGNRDWHGTEARALFNRLLS